MTLLDRMGRWVGLLAAALIVLMFLVPPFYLEVMTAETFKITQEFLIVVIGWFVIGAVAVSRALAGLPVLGGGASSKTRLVLGLLGAWVLITALTAFNRESAWMYSATVLTYLLVGQSLLDWVEVDPSRRKVVLGSIAVLVLLQTFIGILQIAHVPVSEWSKQAPVFADGERVYPWGYWLKDLYSAIGVAAREGNPIGTIGNVNYLGEFLSITLPLLAGWLLTSRHLWIKVLGGVGIAAALWVMSMTGARAAMAGLLVGAALAAVLVFRPGRAMFAKLWTSNLNRLAVGVVSALLIGAVVLVGGGIISKFADRGGEDTSYISRWANWRAAGAIAIERPIVGTGIGGFKLTNVPKLAELYPKGLPLGAAGTRFMQAHNEPLQAAAELGFVGLALAVVTFGFWCRETSSNESLAPSLRFGLIAGLTAVILSGLLGFPFHIPVTALVIVTVLALGLAGREPAGEPVLKPALRPVYAALSALVVAFVGYQVYAKDVHPLYLAHRYMYVGDKMSLLESTDTTKASLTLADRYDRYRGSIRWKLLKTLVVAKDYEAALKVYESSEREGLGKDSLYWKGRALNGLGRKEEAIHTFTDLKNYYPEGHAMHKRAVSNLRRLGVKQPKQEIKEEQPASS